MQSNKRQIQSRNQQNNNNSSNKNNNKNKNLFTSNIPSTEFKMEDETISNNTIQEIQHFFGVTNSLKQKKQNINTFETKYSTISAIRREGNQEQKGDEKESNQEAIQQTQQSQQKDTRDVVKNNILFPLLLLLIIL